MEISDLKTGVLVSIGKRSWKKIKDNVFGTYLGESTYSVNNNEWSESNLRKKVETEEKRLDWEINAFEKEEIVTKGAHGTFIESGYIWIPGIEDIKAYGWRDIENIIPLWRGNHSMHLRDSCGEESVYTVNNEGKVSRGKYWVARNWIILGKLKKNITIAEETDSYGHKLIIPNEYLNPISLENFSKFLSF